jgi:hypothetical protein
MVVRKRHAAREKARRTAQKSPLGQTRPLGTPSESSVVSRDCQDDGSDEVEPGVILLAVPRHPLIARILEFLS